MNCIDIVWEFLSTEWTPGTFAPKDDALLIILASDLVRRVRICLSRLG